MILLELFLTFFRIGLFKSLFLRRRGERLAISTGRSGNNGRFDRRTGRLCPRRSGREFFIADGTGRSIPRRTGAERRARRVAFRTRLGNVNALFLTVAEISGRARRCGRRRSFGYESTRFRLCGCFRCGKKHRAQAAACGTRGPLFFRFRNNKKTQRKRRTWCALFLPYKRRI